MLSCCGIICKNLEAAFNYSNLISMIPFSSSKSSYFSSSLLRIRSAFPCHKDSRSWASHTSPSLAISNPLLMILENKCKSISQLKQIQSQMIITGLLSNGFATSRLIVFLALSETSDLAYCKTLLLNLRNPGTFCYSVAIRAYSDSDSPIEALFLYNEMLRRSFKADNYTFPFLFRSCARLLMVNLGLQVLVHALELGHDKDVFVHNALIHFLVCCGKLDPAKKVFDESSVRDLVSWNSLIHGYARSGKAREVLKIYEEMEREGIEPDEVTMVGVVSACAQLENLMLGREFHLCIVDKGLNFTVRLCNALMDMYVKCGDLGEAVSLFERIEKKTEVSLTIMLSGYAKFGFLDSARKLFHDMHGKDVMQWNALMSGYVDAKQSKEALVLLNEMLAGDTKPDEVTMVICLSACTQLGILDYGIWIHHYVKSNRVSLTVSLGTALVDMYAKCGNMDKALQVFNDMPLKNSFTWTVVISGLALHGNAYDALSYFLEMIKQGLEPDEVTLLGVLSACCHGGLVEEGRRIFLQMSLEFNILPKVKHYSCMVDLLGRAGLVEEAEELIKSMPVVADAAVWGALFSACRVHKKVEVGERAAIKLLELDPHDSGIYSQLAIMYAEANMLHKARNIWKMMRERGLNKTPGCSSIEVDGIVWEFIVSEKSHPQCDQIYECLNKLTYQMQLICI